MSTNQSSQGKRCMLRCGNILVATTSWPCYSFSFTFFFSLFLCILMLNLKSKNKFYKSILQNILTNMQLQLIIFKTILMNIAVLVQFTCILTQCYYIKFYVSAHAIKNSDYFSCTHNQQKKDHSKTFDTCCFKMNSLLWY